MPRTRRERTRSDSSPTRRTDGVIVAIAVFKVIKAAVMIAAGVGLLEALRGRIDLSPFARVLTPVRLKLATAGAFAYAALFLTEGTGLLMRKRWAHWLTIIATASLIPFEIYEILKEVTALKIGTLIVNAAVVAYLIWKLERGGSNPDH